MTYTAPEILLFIAAVGAIMANCITAWRTGAKVDAVSEKADVIHHLTNSAASAATALNDSLRQQNLLLRDALADKTQVAAVLAAAATASEQARLVSDALHATPENKS